MTTTDIDPADLGALCEATSCDCQFLSIGARSQDPEQVQLHHRVLEALDGEGGYDGLIWLYEHMQLVLDGEEKGITPMTLKELMAEHNFADPVRANRIGMMLSNHFSLWRDQRELLAHVEFLRERLSTLAGAATDAAAQAWTPQLGRDVIDRPLGAWDAGRRHSIA